MSDAEAPAGKYYGKPCIYGHGVSEGRTLRWPGGNCAECRTPWRKGELPPSQEGRMDGQCWECGEPGVPLTPKGSPARYHSECQRKIQRLRERKKYHANLDESRYLRRARNMGLTVTQLDALYAKYDSRCGVCNVHESELTSKYAKLCIDHDHACCPVAARACGKCVRGLLCHRCNALLTLTDWVNLEAIKNYLEDA